MGFTKEELVAMKIADAADVLYEIVNEKYFSSAVTVEELLSSVSGEYVEGIKTAENPSEYVLTAAEKVNENKVFTSIIYYLQTALDEALKAE